MRASFYFLSFLLLSCLCPCFSLQAKTEVDYVVVGVGTAGATMAKLLSDDLTTSVFAIHSGNNLSAKPDIKYTKNVFFTLFSPLVGYSYIRTGSTTPQASADLRQLLWLLGIPLGGASSINAGAWCLGTDQVYSQWEAIAGPQWSTAVISDTYKQLENYHGQTTNPAARGTSGPLAVRQIPSPTAFSQKFTEAEINATGYPFVLDYNDPTTPIGISSQMQYTQKGANGRLRVSSATAFLNPSVMNEDGKGVGGRKLKVEFDSTALRTIWKGNKAIGVQYYHKNQIKNVYAKKGVIVCGGLLSSAFLMHSGVGPKEVLAPLGIEVKFDNPNVGNGLVDQTALVAVFSTNPADTPLVPGASCGPNLPSGVNVDFLAFSGFSNLLNVSQSKYRNQILSNIFCSQFEFPENSIFSQIAWLPDPTGDPTVREIRITTLNPVPGLAVAIVDLLQPSSRGQIVLKNFNPFTPPAINSGILSNSNDLDLYVRAFQVYIKNINTALQLIDEDYELIFPDPALLDDTVLLTEFIKGTVQELQHWQCHCRMAPLDQGGVVDSRGQVYGVRHFYVADNSINPVGMDGSPMATAFLVAANIARLLQE